MKTKIFESSSISDLEKQMDDFFRYDKKTKVKREVKFLSFSTNSVKETTILGFSISYTGVFHCIVLFDEY
jgi:hypothetical protein